MHQRIIRKEKDGYHVYSEDGKKHLGGPYETEGEAKKRLEQIDYFKNKGQKSIISVTERRDWSGSMGTELNYAGYQNAKKLIKHGKINEGDFRLSAGDKSKILGPEGTDVAEHSRHHLGIKRSNDYDQPESPKDHQYPIIKDGEVYTKALHRARNEAHEAGHEGVKGAASELLGDAKLSLDPSERGSASVIVAPEKRFLTLETAELRVKRTAESTVIEGCAARFDSLSQDLGGFVEKIDKKAFDRCLQRCDVRGLKNHDPGQLLGRTGSGTMRLSIRDDGLYYEIDAPDTQVGRDTMTEIERGDISGSSFSFTLEPTDGDEWDDDTDPPTRTLRNVRDLFDVGPVSFPAYLDTSSSTRALVAHIESRNLARRERDNQWKRLRILKLRMGHSIS